jgi:hypothetical protein
MAFAVNTPAGQVRLEDLPLEVLERIEAESGETWPTILFAPGSKAKMARVVYTVACEHMGAEVKQITAKDILSGDLFEMVEDDRPTLYEDGIPKAADEESTSGSSGASDSSAGLPT